MNVSIINANACTRQLAKYKQDKVPDKVGTTGEAAASHPPVTHTPQAPPPPPISRNTPVEYHSVLTCRWTAMPASVALGSTFASSGLLSGHRITPGERSREMCSRWANDRAVKCSCS